MLLKVLDMGLNRYRLGSLITPVDERNTFGYRDFYGINIHKEFMPTVANTEGLDETKYKVVRKNRFVFSGMQTGRDQCIRISMYTEDNPIIVSPAYTTFEVTAVDIVLPMYFFMLFLSKERDRLGAFYSDGSIRSNLDWDRFCDIELDLPSVPVQQKYVDIYKAMVANQKSYERGLEDLKLAIDITIDKLKNNAHRVRIGALLREVDNRNTDKSVVNVQGININKQFMPTVANTTGTNLTNYKVVTKGQFAFSGMQTGRDMCIRIALYDKEEPIIISPAYTVLQTNSSEVISEYIMIWFSRKESDRFGWFLSDASIRSNLDLDSFFDTKIPLPDISIQKSIADIYKVYATRKQINEQLKEQIKNICPILIKGSLEEGK